MTNYKFIINNNETEASASKESNTRNPAQNRKRHKPVKGLPRTIG